MPYSNYPNGFTKGVTIRGIPLTMAYPGHVYWVDGSSVTPPVGVVGGQDGNPGTFTQPFATIDYAFGRCVDSRGDIIMVKPGHSETIETDGGLAADVAGVAIIGLGTGTLRPKIVLDTAAAAAVAVSAANVTFMNIVMEASFADITNAVDVTATNAAFINCEWQEEGADLNFLDIIACTGAANTADGLTVIGCRSTSIDAGINSFINITDDLDGMVCNDNYVNHDHANALAMVLQATGKDLTNLEFLGNRYMSLKTSGDIFIDNDTTANSGIAANNYALHADTGTEVLFDCDGIGLFENYATAVVTASGYLLPAADS
jgi:hypothetical protein